MPNLLVRNIEAATIERLKERAEAHHRSLQGEAKVLLETAASAKTLTEFRQEIAAWQAYWGDRVFPDSTPEIREDRDR